MWTPDYDPFRLKDRRIGHAGLRSGMKTRKKPKATGIIPSPTAVCYVVHQLRAMQHRAMKDAIVIERAGGKPEARSLRLQADDFRQVAQFLEERLIR